MFIRVHILGPLHIFCFLDKELEMLRGENRKNMLLSVALLVISAVFYYVFFYNEEEPTGELPREHVVVK